VAVSKRSEAERGSFCGGVAGRALGLASVHVPSRPFVASAPPFSGSSADAAVLRETGLLLEGLRCAGCVRKTEEALRALPGVASASVNYGDHRALVRFDAGVTDLPRIVSAVSALGYQAVPYDPETLDRPIQRESRAALARLLIAAFLAMNVMWLAIALYIGTYQGMDAATQRGLRWLAAALSLPAIAWCGAPFFAGAWRGLRRRELSMDLPVAIAISTAFATNVAGTALGRTHLFVDSSAWIVFLLLLGRTLERRASARAFGAVERLRNLAPREALRRRGAALERVAVSDLAVGDELAIGAGELIPLDATLIGPAAEIDESAITGESAPVTRAPNADLAAGTRNLMTEIAVRVAAPATRGTLARLAALLERAQTERPRIQRSADRFAAAFAPAVLALAALTAVALALRGDPWIDVAFRATTVLIVACPCVFGLATPLAIGAALGRAAELGVLVKSGEALERVARTTRVLLDKTGTLTEGRFSLLRAACASGVTEPELLGAAAFAEGAATHPIAEAIRRAATEAGVTAGGNAKRETRAGLGVIARAEGGARIALGAEALLRELALAPPPELAHDAAQLGASGATLVWVARDGQVLGLLAFEDAPRADARAFVARLAAARVEAEIVSGDHERAVEFAAERAGIAVRSPGATPESKVERVRAHREAGDSVLAVGDGLNDAAFLAAADAGLAMARGSEITLAAADAVVRSPHLGAIADLLELSRATLACIRENFAFALLYNAIAVPLAVAGVLHPLGAAIAMALSSLSVTANSMRLLRFRAAR
jgi:Cu2+-exporting ATPase